MPTAVPNKTENGTASSLFRDGNGPRFTLHGDEYRYRLLFTVVACEFLTILITWSLWGHRESPVNLPLISLSPLPFQILLLASLGLTLMRPRFGAIAHAVIFSLACVDDQYRVQPQMICFTVILLALVFQQGLWFSRWYLAAMWTWTGIHKLLSPDWLGAGSWNFLARCGIDVGDGHIVFAIGVAVTEIAIGIAAVFAPRRAAIGCVVLHVGVLISLSPLVRNHNPSVWPWNFVVAVVGGWILTQELPITSRLWQYAAAAAILIPPAGFYFNLVNPYVAHVLYSGNKPQAYHTTGDGVKRLDGYNDQAYPLPNSRRLFRQIFETIGEPGDKLFVYDPRWGMTNQHFLLDQKNIAIEIDRKRFYSSDLAGAADDGLSGIELPHHSVAWRLQRRGAKLEKNPLDRYSSVTIDGKSKAISLDDVWLLHNLRHLEISYAELSSTELAGCTRLQYFNSLKLVNCEISADGLKALQQCHFLNGIHLSETSISTTGIEVLVSIKQLTAIRITNCNFDDDALLRIRELPDLTRLDVSHTEVTSAGLSQIDQLPTLNWLDLSATNIDDNSLDLVAQLPNLEVLNLSNTTVTDKGLEALATLKKLRRLELTGTQTTDSAVDTLVTLRKLIQLDVRQTGITNVGVTRLITELPFCNIRRDEED
jgi:Leucine-rich repeat (LRR) protein